jgi:beta-N-acetylhexosaminidase
MPHVTDPTTSSDRYLLPFRDAIQARSRLVMVSSATYPNIDPTEPACFSPAIMTVLLRTELGFHGVVISDDLGTSALSLFPLAERALRFFAAGGTLLLDTSPRQIPVMIKAVIAAQASDPSFAGLIKAAVLTDLAAKAADSLVSS